MSVPASSALALLFCSDAFTGEMQIFIHSQTRPIHASEENEKSRYLPGLREDGVRLTPLSSGYSRAKSYPWSPFPPRRARPGPGPLGRGFTFRIGERGSEQEREREIEGGLAFKALRLLYHSTLGLKVTKKKKEDKQEEERRYTCSDAVTHPDYRRTV